MTQYTSQTTFQTNQNTFKYFPHQKQTIQKRDFTVMPPTNSHIDQILDNKKKFLQWLKLLNISQRSQKFTFTNKSFTLLVLQMNHRKKYYSQRFFAIREQIESNTLILSGKEALQKVKNKNQSEAQTELIKNLLIISKEQLYDSISLNQRLLCNLQKLFQLFDMLEHDNVQQLTLQQYKSLIKEGKEQCFYKLEMKNENFKSIGQWLVKVFKMQIWSQYYNQYNQNEQEKKLKQKKKINKIWKQLTFEKKVQLIKIPPYKELIQLLIKEKSDQKINQLSLFKTEIPTEAQIHLYIKSLNLPHQIDIFQYLTEYSILEASQKLTCIKWLIFIQIRKLLHDTKDLRNKKKNKIKLNKKKKFQKCEKIDKVEKNEKLIINQKLQITQKNEVAIENKISDPKKVGEKVSIKLTSIQKRFIVSEVVNGNFKQEKQNDLQIKDVIKKDLKSNKPKTKNPQIREKQKKKKKYIEVQDFQEKSNETIQDFQRNQKSITSNETNETNVFHQQYIQQLSEQQIQKRKNIIQSIYQQKLKGDIVETADYISQIANSYSPYRIIAYNRIQYLLQIWGVQIKIFGSCATGLALANSDIDLAVDSSILNYFYYTFGSNRDKVCAALNSIYQILQKRIWINNIRLILTANIPVLKFEILTHIQFQESQRDPFLNLIKQKQKNKKVIIKVDLTVENFNNISQQSNHLGIMATRHMNDWMKQYPTLHTVSIIIKYLLKKKQLNNVYKGGLSTYCIMIMIIAYLQIKKLKNQTDSSKVFYGFLQYYIEQFKNEQIGIDITNRNNPFFALELSQNSKIQVKDPLNAKIISSNSYQYEKILQEFNAVRQLRLQILQELNSYLLKPQIKLNQKHQYFTKNLLLQYFNTI